MFKVYKTPERRQYPLTENQGVSIVDLDQKSKLG